MADSFEQPASDSNWLEQQWDIARLKQQQLESPSFILAIDEIQKIGDWSNIVKTNWDRDTWNDTPIKVILMGSAQLSIHLI
jgi:predicted AAA+ superfamily ATPase